MNIKVTPITIKISPIIHNAIILHKKKKSVKMLFKNVFKNVDVDIGATFTITFTYKPFIRQIGHNKPVFWICSKQFLCK